MKRLWIANLFAAIVLVFSAGASAQEIRNVTVGWGDALRLGRWTPIFVTVEDAQAREVDLQIHGTYGEKGEALWVHQTAVAQPLPVTYCLLYPINAQLSRIVVIVSDAKTGQTLDSRALQYNGSFTPAGQVPIHILAPNDILIGISGSIDDAQSLAAQLKEAHVPAGILDPYHLPANFAGYDSISLLILSSPDFSTLKPEQEQAILQWITRGGNLLFIPPSTPLPEGDPLISALPATIGTNSTMQPAAAGLASTRPSSLNDRILTPRPGATAFKFLGQTGYHHQLGLGQIAVVPIDFSPLQFAQDHAANDFWRSLLAPMLDIPKITPPTSLTVSDEDEVLVPGPNASETVGRGQRESDAIRHVLKLMSASQSTAGIPWKSSLLFLAGICFLLGPVDSIVTMRLGQRRQNWLTLLASAGLIASLAGLVVAQERKPSISLSTLRLIDQVGGSTVAATDIIAVNSNRPATVPLSLDRLTWWEPANQSARSLRPERFVDANCRQDKTGCRPETVQLSGLEAQAWHGESAESGPALLTAKLHVTVNADKVAHIIGSITNRSATPMTDFHIITPLGEFEIAAPLTPAASMNINADAVPTPSALTGLPADVADIAPERADRAADLLKSGRAIVVCQMPAATDVKTGMDPAAHWQILRAVVQLAP